VEREPSCDTIFRCKVGATPSPMSAKLGMKKMYPKLLRSLHERPLYLLSLLDEVGIG